MLLPRILSALVGIPLLLGLIHLGSTPFLVLTVAIAALSLYEYASLLWLGGRGVQREGVVLGGTALAAAVALGSSPLQNMTLGGLIAWIVLRELLRRDHSLDRAAMTLFGAVFIGWTLAHLALIRRLRPDGEGLMFFLFLTVWICDSAAYFAGKGFGRRSLAPVVSPKKTWEGAVAGFSAATIAGAAIARWLLPAYPTPLCLALAAGISAVAQLSDLSKSMIKRSVGAKDSSALLPGHGGVLDRFDSFLLAAPVLYYAVTLVR